MEKTTNSLEALLDSVFVFVNQISESKLREKPSPEKWSKKEILGHLVDSGINNLQRFTEIQFEAKPYKIRRYDQDALVKANDYQNADINEIINLLLAINTRIINLIRQQTDKTLKFKVEIDVDNIVDLNFLVHDYVKHFEHHVKQIVK